MNRFNLSFKGIILPGYELERVQTRLASALGLPSPDSTTPFFSGKPVTLRRNLDRKVAADWYRKLRDIGMDVELVKATDAITSESETTLSPADAPAQQDTTAAATASQKPESTAKNTDATDTAHVKRRGMDKEIHQSQPGQIDQSWAVPSSRGTSNVRSQKTARAQVSDEQRRAQADAAARLAAEQAAEAVRRQQLEEDARRKAQQKLELERKQQEEQEQQAAQLAAQREAKARRDAEELKKAKEAAEAKAKEAAQLKASQQAEAAREAALQAQREAKAKAERERLAQEEAQRQHEEQRKAEQLAAAEAARARAAALEEKRKAAARDALQKAEEEERKRAAAQALAHKKAKEKKRKAEKAAREKAAREAEKARLKAEREEARRKAHAAAEQAKAEQEQARLKAREEAQRAKAEREAEKARLKVERDEARRKAHAAAEQARAAQEQARRKAREDALRVKAEKAEIARLAARNAAAEKARQEAQRVQREAELAEQRAREEEARLLAAAEAARQKAEEEHRKAEAAAKLQAQQEEARLAQKLAQAEAEQARKAELAAQKQQRAKEKRRQAEEKAKRKASKQAEHERQQALALAERAKLEDQVIATGAAKLKDTSTGASSKPRVKTRLDVPTRLSQRDATRHSGRDSWGQPESTTSASDASPAVHAPRYQQGAPNLYTLTAFHNSQECRQRPAESAVKARRGMLIIGAMLTVLAISIAAFALRTPATVQRGPIAITSSSDGKLLVLGTNALYLHDRSGLGILTLSYRELGLESLQPALHLRADGTLFGLGIRRGSTTQAELIRCVLADKQCTQVLDKPGDQTPAVAATGFAINELNSDRYVLSEPPAALQRYNAQGDLLARASLPIAEQPILRLDSGLIFINSAFDSAISVFRPDVANFGEQLDEVLLMPPSAIANQHSLVLDFLPLNQQWWVVLGDPQSQSSALYRFDASWRFISEFPLPVAYYPARLSSWNDKILVSHPSQIQQIRLSNEGLEEAHYQSNLLVEALSATETAAVRQELLRRTLPALLLALTLIAMGYTWTHRLRSRVYQHSRAHGAESLDGATDIRWVGPDPQRTVRYRQLALLVATGYAGVLVTSIGLALAPTVLAAILLVLSGPAVTLYLLYRTPVGHIGSRDDTLVLVDHNGLYHMGQGPRIQYRSRFVLIDDVAVFTGASLLPTFEPNQLKSLEPTITAGVKVENKAIWVRLLQARHPLALGSIVCAIGTIMAGLVLIV